MCQSSTRIGIVRTASLTGEDDNIWRPDGGVLAGEFYEGDGRRAKTFVRVIQWNFKFGALKVVETWCPGDVG